MITRLESDGRSEVRGQIAEVKLTDFSSAVRSEGFHFCNLTSNL